MIIPGHGPMARRADLVRYRDMLINLRNRVGQGIAAGRTLDQIKAEGHADAYGRDTDFISPDAFTETIYRSLMRDRRPAGELGGAEHPLEDRVDMLEMMVEVELRLDLGRREQGGHLRRRP